MLNEIERLARPAILSMTPYSSARTTGKQDDVSVYLDANECPYSPYPGDEATLGYNYYPKPQPPELVAVLSAHYGIEPGRLMITRGADESIDMLVRIFCRENRDAIVITPPAFPMYAVSAQTQGAAIRKVPLTMETDGWLRDCRVDVNGVLAACADETVPAKLVFICSPNNPTSGLLNRDDILSLCTRLHGKALVVVDEAYLEFSGQPSISEAIDDHPNLIVLRSLSKEYALAGERCGMTIAHPDVIQLMGRILAPYPIPRSVLRAVLRAMTPEGITYARRNIREAVEQRHVIEDALRSLPGAVKGLFRSDTNFLLVEVTDAPLLVAMMGDRGIKIRDRSTVPGIEGCVRISVGTPDQNQQVLAVLRAYADRVARGVSPAHAEA